MYLAGYIVAGFLVAGVYAAAWLHGRRDRYHRTGLVVALSFAALAAPVQVIVGDWAGRQVAENQPVKLAAFEGLPKTQDGAPFTIGGFYDAERGEVALRHRDPEAALAARPPRPERARSSASTRCRPTTGRRSTSCASRSRRWSGSARRSALLGVMFFVHLAAQAAAAALARGSTGRWWPRGRCRSWR